MTPSRDSLIQEARGLRLVKTKQIKIINFTDNN